MPHTNRKKKTSSSSSSNKPTAKPTLVHVKRQEIQDDDGWTHVIDKPRTRRSTVSRSANGGLHVGDFEVNGVSYVNKTLEELKTDYQFWKKGWEEAKECKLLKDRLQGRDAPLVPEELAEEEGKNEGLDQAAIKEMDTERTVGDGEKETNAEDKDDEATPDDQLLSELEYAFNQQAFAEAALRAAESRRRRAEEILRAKEAVLKYQNSVLSRSTIDNVVVLGLGSLQSARREGRRASATQLAALQTIVSILSGEGAQETKIVFQEPAFTALDTEFLASLSSPAHSYSVVSDPEAFTHITSTTLVYAIHCYGAVYKAVADCKERPAVVIGTDVENFGRFNVSETAEAVQKSLEELVQDCEILEFPQVRSDFSDTKIYWRPSPTTT